MIMTKARCARGFCKKVVSDTRNVFSQTSRSFHALSLARKNSATLLATLLLAVSRYFTCPPCAGRIGIQMLREKKRICNDERERGKLRDGTRVALTHVLSGKRETLAIAQLLQFQRRETVSAATETVLITPAARAENSRENWTRELVDLAFRVSLGIFRIVPLL